MPHNMVSDGNWSGTMLCTKLLEGGSPMPGHYFGFIKHEPEESPAGVEPVRAFEENFQTALLLALLQRGLINQRHFDLCLQELKETKA